MCLEARHTPPHLGLRFRQSSEAKDRTWPKSVTSSSKRDPITTCTRRTSSDVHERVSDQLLIYRPMTTASCAYPDVFVLIRRLPELQLLNSTSTPIMTTLQGNRTLQILSAAAKGNYGVLAAIAYDVLPLW